MSHSGRFTAVLDRIEDGVAVLLIESDGEVIDEESVEPDDLPAGVEAGAVLEATYDDGSLRRLVFQPEETDSRRSALRERFDDLAERPPDSGGTADDANGDTGG